MSNYNEIVAKCLYCSNASAHQTKCMTSRGSTRLDGRCFTEHSVICVTDNKSGQYVMDNQYTLKLKGICPYCQYSLAVSIKTNMIQCNQADPNEYDYEEMSLGYLRKRGDSFDDPMIKTIKTLRHYKPEEIWPKLGKCPNCVIVEPECINGAFICPDCGWRST